MIEGPSVITDTTQVIITWKTDEPSDSTVEYGLDTSYGSVAKDEKYVTDHSITLTGLGASTTYHYRIKSSDPFGNEYVGDDMTFTTEEEEDTIPPVILEGPSVTGISDKQVTVLWVTDEPSDSLVRYGVDTSYGSVKSYVAYVTEHSVTLTGLEASTTYHYRVEGRDSSGNGPTQSDDMTFTTAEEPDTVAPVILEGPTVLGITDKQVTITWTTDEPGDSVVKYGLDESYGSVKTDPEDVTEHSIVITGLTPSTEYHYKVESTDAYHNGPTQSVDLTFTTAEKPDIVAPEITDGPDEMGITHNQVTIVWTTDEISDSVVEYGLDETYGSIKSDPEDVTEHSITLTGLTPTTTYHYRVKSTDPSGNGPTQSEDFTFTTEETPDTVAPVITEGPEATGITDTQVTITWTTDEISDSVVEYGTDTTYGSTKSSPTDVTAHSITITGLIPNTTYHYLVKSTDPSGNGPAQSDDFTFTTEETPDTVAPVITEGPEATGITDTQVTITWTTDEISDSVVEYGTDTTYGSTKSSPTDVTEHSITITGLTPDTTYHYRVKSTDPSGNGPAQSEDFTFTTLTSNIAPTITVTAPPSGGADVDASYTITWSASDPDAGDTLTITLYYDADTDSSSGLVEIASSLSNTGSYSWDISSVTVGSYYIYGVVSDGTVTGSDYSDGAVTIQMVKLWEFTTGGEVYPSPAVGSEGTIYAGSWDNNIYAINPDGSKKWEFTTGGDVYSSVIGSDGTIYVGSYDDKLYAINPDGSKKWEFTAGAHVRSTPAIALDGTIYWGSDDWKLYAIKPDGTKKWEFLTGGTVFSSPAIGSDGTIYVGSRDNKLYAINPDGSKKWEFLTGGWVDSSPAIGSDGTIYVGSYDNKLYAINPDGSEKWEFTTVGSVISSPVIGSDGTVYVGSNDKKLYAVNSNGTKKWDFVAGDVFGEASPAVGSDGTIYVGSYDNKFYAINSDGSKKWEFTTGYRVTSSPAIGSDGTIYVGSHDYKLYAIRDSGVTGLASSNWPMFHHDAKHTGGVQVSWGLSVVWSKTYGGSGGDGARALSLDSSGNIYVAGLTESFGVGGADVLLLKYDPSGSLLWQKTWGGSGDEAAYALSLDSSGNVYVAGWTKSFGVGNQDILLLKYDPSGSLLWQKTWGGSGNDGANALSLDSSENVYVAGLTESFGVGSGDILLLKYDSSGSLLWQKTWGGDSHENAGDLSFDSSGNFYVTGWTRSYGIGHWNSILLKYDSSGSLLWQKTWSIIQEIPGYNDSLSHSLSVDSSGNIYVTGMAKSGGEAENYDVFLLKYGSSGDLLWQKKWGGNAADDGSGLSVDSSGNVYVAGLTDSFGGGDVFLFKYSSSGDLLWQKTWGGSGNDGAYALSLDSSGNIYVAGYTESYTGVWQDVSGTVGIPNGSAGSPSGTVTTPSGTVGTPSGIETTPTGSETGVGGSDVLLLKVAP